MVLSEDLMMTGTTLHYCQTYTHVIVNMGLAQAHLNHIFFSHLPFPGNECISQLCRCLQTQFVSYSMDVAEYIMHQFDEQEFTTNEHALSMIKLVSLVRVHQRIAPSTFSLSFSADGRGDSRLSAHSVSTAAPCT